MLGKAYPSESYPVVEMQYSGGSGNTEIGQYHIMSKINYSPHKTNEGRSKATIFDMLRDCVTLVPFDRADFKDKKTEKTHHYFEKTENYVVVHLRIIEPVGKQPYQAAVYEILTKDGEYARYLSVHVQYVHTHDACGFVCEEGSEVYMEFIANKFYARSGLMTFRKEEKEVFIFSQYRDNHD